MGGRALKLSHAGQFSHASRQKATVVDISSEPVCLSASFLGRKEEEEEHWSDE
jgi:hypothetical protein